MTYNWQLPDWPAFSYNLDEIQYLLLDFGQRAGRIGGLLEGLPEAMHTEAMIETMVSEAVKTSEIEGEYLSRSDVMSSIRNNLGLAEDAEPVRDEKADGAAALMIDVRRSYAETLKEDKLFDWHRMIMKGSLGIKTDEWRSHQEPMQVISGALGEEKIQYEAPPSDQVPDEMARFIDWFNDTAPGGASEIRNPVVRSAIAHVYFETVHPFEDGNGRIGRAVSEKALSQGLRRPVLLSLSKAIEADKNAYYNALQRAQRSNEITPWVVYFANMAIEAQSQAEVLVGFTLKKAKFFDRFGRGLNERQLKVVRRMLEEGPKGFEGGMSAKKYISITRTSKATATRDLQDLVGKKAFIFSGDGRSRRYNINLDPGKINL